MIVPHDDNFDPNFHYDILCDGGCLNQGTDQASCYGSWRLRTANGKSDLISKKPFPEGMTNNQAEYLAVIMSVEDLLCRIRGAKKLPKDFSVRIMSDSELIINQINGTYRTKNSYLMKLKHRSLDLLMQLEKFEMVKVPEFFVKTILGH